MTLVKLVLENFKGIRALTLEPNGRDMRISGENGTGKTTCADAFTWLVSSKDSLGRSDFALKTLDENGKELHNLEHSVEGVLNIDEQQITLKKTFKEKYVKRRGQARAEFTGHTTDYEIDGVPTSKADWDAKIKSIIDEDTLKLLTSPTHFNSLHWQKRRQILLDVCGDISDADVIASNKDLGALPDILGNRSIDDLRQIVGAKKRKINDSLKEIPARIDELTKGMAEVMAYNVAEIETRITRLELQIQKTKDNTNTASLRKRKAELEVKIAEAKSAWHVSRSKDEAKLDESLRNVTRDLNQAKGELQRITGEIAGINSTVQRNDQELVRLRKEFIEIRDQEYTGASVCPTCGQDLPGDQVDAAQQKHNKQKARKLEQINRQGKELKTANEQNLKVITAHQEEKTRLEEAIKDLTAKAEQIGKDKAEYLEHMDKAEAEATADLNIKLTETIEAISNTAVEDTSSLEQELLVEQAKLAEVAATKKAHVRVDELAEEEKTLAAEYESLEHQDYLMDQFTVAKVGMLEGKINSRFKLARFKLFSEQINGGVSETCVTLYDGVPYGSGLNSGAEIMIGCDIVKTLQEYYGIRAPLWLDHAESCRYPIDMDCQTIFMEVSGDEELNIKIEEDRTNE